MGPVVDGTLVDATVVWDGAAHLTVRPVNAARPENPRGSTEKPQETKP